MAFCSCPCFFLSPLLLAGCGSSGDSGLDRWTCHLPHLLLAGVSGSVGVGGDDVEVLLVLAGLELPGSPSCVGSVCRTLFLVFPATLLSLWALARPLFTGFLLGINVGSFDEPHSDWTPAWD